MTAEILDLKKAKEGQTLVLICGSCSSTTFLIHVDGAFECSFCGEIMVDDISGVDYSEVQEAQKETYTRTNTDCITEDLAFRRVLSKAKVGDTAAVVVMNMDGNTVVWSIGAKTDRDMKWFQERVNALMDQLK